VNAAPLPQSALPFELEELIAMTPLQTAQAGLQRPDASWSGRLRLPQTMPAHPGATPVVLIELIDRAIERDEVEHPWENRSLLPKFRDRPVAVGVSIHRLP
jgi:hypothetical protein